jgi:hypothetical protein
VYVVTSCDFGCTDQFDFSALTAPAKAGDKKNVQVQSEVPPGKPVAALRQRTVGGLDAARQDGPAQNIDEERVAAIVHVLRRELESNNVKRAARSPPAPTSAPVDVECSEAITANRRADIEFGYEFSVSRRTTAALKILVASAIAAPVAYLLAVATAPPRANLSAAPTLAPADTPPRDMAVAIGSNGTGVSLANSHTGAPNDKTPAGRPSERSNADNWSEADKVLAERNRHFHEAANAIEAELLYRNAANANDASFAVGLEKPQIAASIDGRAPSGAMGVDFGNFKSWYDQAKELWIAAPTRWSSGWSSPQPTKSAR